MGVLLKKLAGLALAAGLLQALAAAPAPPTDTSQVRRALRTADGLLQRNADSAHYLGQQLLGASRRLGYRAGVAGSYRLLARAYLRRGRYDSCLYYAGRAEPLFETPWQPRELAGLYVLYALAYKKLGDDQHLPQFSRTGVAYGQRALRLARRAAAPDIMAKACLNLGILYRDLGRLDSAGSCYRQAIALAERLPSAPSPVLPTAYADLGQLLMDAHHDYAGAVRLLRRALALHRRQHNLEGQEHAYRTLSWAYRQAGLRPQSLATADSGVVLGRALGDPHRLINSLESAYAAYRDAGQYATAIRLQEERTRLQEQQGQVEKAQAVARVEAAYQLEKKQARIDWLARQARQQQRRQWLLLGGVAVLSGLLAANLAQYRALRRSNARLRASHRTEHAQAQRLQVLLRELHHRVKNNLSTIASLLRLQGRRLTDHTAQRALQESRQRVEAMSLIHQRLYQTSDVTTVDMHAYLADLTESLLQGYGYPAAGVDLALDVPTVQLDVDVAVPLGLIINELITNALKHAFPHVARPWLSISLRQSAAEGLRLEVADNGPGFPFEAPTPNSSSFGRRLIGVLSEQLGGQATECNAPGFYYRLHLAPAALAQLVRTHA